MQTSRSKRGAHVSVIFTYPRVRGLPKLRRKPPSHKSPMRKSQQVFTMRVPSNSRTSLPPQFACFTPPQVRVIIIDNHRPVWHGHNEDADELTLVMVDQDDPVPKSCVPEYTVDHADLEAEAAGVRV
jgi:cell division control protein 45